MTVDVCGRPAITLGLSGTATDDYTVTKETLDAGATVTTTVTVQDTFDDDGETIDGQSSESAVQRITIRDDDEF